MGRGEMTNPQPVTQQIHHLQSVILDAIPQEGVEGELLAIALLEALATVIARCATNAEEISHTFAEGLVRLVSARLRDRVH